MAIRIYALAKELRVDSLELVNICSKAGLSGKGSALASLSDDEAGVVRQIMLGNSAARNGSRQTFQGVTNGRTAAKVAVASPPLPSPSPPVRVAQPQHAPKPQTPPPAVRHKPELAGDTFVTELLNDLAEARQLLTEQDSPFHRRVFVRTCVYAVEGVLAAMDDACGRVFNKYLYSDAVEQIVDRYSESKNRDAAQAAKNVSDLVAIPRKVRNRITHPRQSKGVDVADEELVVAMRLDVWLIQIVGLLGIAPPQMVLQLPDTGKPAESAYQRLDRGSVSPEGNADVRRRDPYDPQNGDALQWFDFCVGSREETGLPSRLERCHNAVVCEPNELI